MFLARGITLPSASGQGSLRLRTCLMHGPPDTSVRLTLVGAAPAVTANSAHRGPSGGLPRVEDALAVVAQRPKQHNGFLPHTKTPQGAGQGTRQGWGRQDDQAFFTLQLLESSIITKYEGKADRLFRSFNIAQ